MSALEQDPATLVLYEVREQVAIITLNRPARMNAFTLPMVDAWAQRLWEAQADPSVNVILVTGNGGGFCAGIDLVWLDDETATAYERKSAIADHVHRVPLALENIDKPVIAAINGVAVGAGLDMALMCDIRFAARSARMAESYINVGLVPGDGGCFLLPRLIGLPKALELLLTGEMLDAEHAEKLGMVNHVCEDGELFDSAFDFARRIASKPPIAVRMIKRATYQSLRTDFRTSLDLISSHLAVNRTTHDSVEAYNAFRDKRTPSFRGS